MKELNNGNKNFSANDFGISDDDFEEQVSFLVREDYITKPMYASDKIYLMRFVNLTEKGETFLNENSFSHKVYSNLKEVRDWIKQ